MKKKQFKIRPMLSDDWEAVGRIYKEGIATGFATFETEVPTWEVWDQKHLNFGRLVATFESEVVGWIALSPVSHRAVYRGVAELSIYIASKWRSNGIGQYLLETLIPMAEEKGFWTLQSAVFPENLTSIQLHLRNGFRKIGFRERIAQLNGQWKDNILLERRSSTI